MKLRDFVVNSLPRVRGKKKPRGNPPPEMSAKGRHDTPPQPPVRVSSISRESSVERASHVAVADVNWRQFPPRMLPDETGLVGSLTYYSPPPGMVMSHSAEGISTHSLAVMTSHGSTMDYSGPYSQTTTMSESAVNYSMPSGVMLQSQHHHRHSHKHDYHYVYHHHHHHQYPQEPSPRGPLVENSNYHHTVAPRKPEQGFLKKSFASFKAMRKQRNSVKDPVSAKTKPGDENGKCAVCPYPQLYAMAGDAKKPSETRPAKPKRKGLKSLRKSKQNQEEQLDKSWFSDNDASNASSHHLSDADLFHNATMQRPRFRECSVESCMSRLYGSQDGCCGTDNDFKGMDSHSLSGYESDLPRGKSGRTRSRIKTNPWLPSPQPSLNIGRRFENCDFRESREDVMTVDDDYFPSMPRSASFDYQRPAVLSSFQTTSSKGRPVQRHRSLTPSDLKMTLSLKKNSDEVKPSPSDSLQHPTQIRSQKASMNDLSLSVPKSRSSSILSPSSEFIILTDNIEQLANNISFEYEEMLDTTLERVSACPEDGKLSIQELFTDEESTGNGKNNDVAFSESSQVNSNAHSPDSGIGGLGSSDGDELTMANAPLSGLSPLLSSVCLPSAASGQEIMSSEGDKNTSDSVIIGRNQPTQENLTFSSFRDGQNNFYNHSQDTRNRILKSSFSDSMESTMNVKSDAQTSSNIDGSLFSNSTHLNNFRKNHDSTTFLKSKDEPCNGETIQLPPNITRSELTTPVESPTENWQFDVSLLSQIQPDTDYKVQKSNQVEMAQSETSNVRSSENRPSSVQMNLIPFKDGHLESKYNFKHDISNTMVDDVAKRVDFATETNSLDWADASVQTDFNDEENDSCHDNPSRNLDNLCDEEFDAIESTRRWLLTGNMQGSADTGYSSQPRDSQILMDDDDYVTAGDNHSEIRSTPPTYHVTGGGEIPAIAPRTSGILSQDRKIDREMSNFDKDSQPSKCPKVKKRTQSEELVYSMFSGIESQFDDIFHQLSSPQNITELPGNKRDSSGSSTSTLISEGIGSASISAPFCDQSGFDERTPRNSGCDQFEFKNEEPLKHSQCIMRKKVSKKMKNNTDNEPDYVNVPRKGLSAKFNGEYGRGMSEKKSREHHVNSKKCTMQSYPHVSQGVELCHPEFKVSSSSPFSNNMASTDRADYLEFLRDAPLKNTHCERSMFLIPGFGPIDMSSVALKRMPHASWTSRSTTKHLSSNGARTHIRAPDSEAAHSSHSLISEGKSDVKSKSKHNQRLHDSSHLNPSSKKNNETNESRSGPCRKDLPDKPKRKNPRVIQSKPSSTRNHGNAATSPLLEQPCQDGSFRSGSPLATKIISRDPSSYQDNSTRSLAERVWQLQREKDLIYLQLKEVQQEELSRHRHQLQHHRNVHSRRKDVLLETLQELKANLEEQSRKLNLACNQDVYI